MLISSTIASASLGSTIESSRIIRALELERGGKPEATLWFGAAEKLPVAAAARVNAVMSDAAASDDSDLRNIVHAGTTACATSLAVAEKTGASGQDVLAAIVLGYEVAGRMNGAMIGGLQKKGFHGCIVAGFAGAVAAGHLMKLTQPQMAQAIALIATSMGGLHAAANTSVAREYHAGLAAMLGVNAAQAAGLGFVAEENILETERGFFEVYGNKPDVAEVTRDFGKRWSILTDMGIKLVPGGHPSHATAEAAANAAREGNVSPDEVETITISRPGFTGVDGSAVSDRSHRHCAQPGVFCRRRRCRPGLHLGARLRREDQQPGDPRPARQSAGRRSAHGEPGALQVGRDRDHQDQGRPHVIRARSMRREAPPCSASPGPMSKANTARSRRMRSSPGTISKRA